MLGDGHPFKGKHHSPESLAKMSASKIGVPIHTPESRRKLSLAAKGKTISEEHKQRLREIHRTPRLYEIKRKAHEKLFKIVVCDNDGLEFKSIHEAAAYYGVTVASVYASCHGVYRKGIGDLRFRHKEKSP